MKAAVVLLVTLPMLAYVAGRLVAAPPDLGSGWAHLRRSDASHSGGRE